MKRLSLPYTPLPALVLLLAVGSVGSSALAQTQDAGGRGGKPEASGSAPAQAASNAPPEQVTTEQETLARLDRKVRLQQRAVTLPAVLAALSEQTGLQIEAVAYLRERRLTALMNDVSAREALDTLGELNDWKWQITAPGHVLLGRPLARTPHQIADVSLALQAALPRDMRRFLGSAGTLRDAMHHAPGEKGYVPEKSLASVGAFQSGGTVRMLVQAHEFGGELAASLEPQIRDQKPVAWAALTPEQRRLLIRAIISEGFVTISGEEHKLLTGLLAPYERDPQSADIGLKNGNCLLIGTTIIGTTADGRPSFKATITVYIVDAPGTGDKEIRFP